MEAVPAQVHKRYRAHPRRDARLAADRLVERFGVIQRVEHLVLTVSFVVLAVTGVPQKFAGADLSQWIIAQMGGIDTARFLHRTFAVVFMVLALEHVAAIVVGLASKRMRPTMSPAWTDVENAVQTVRYCLGLSPSHPRFDRYDFRQKFEYWGIVFGSMVMVLTGLILWFPALVTEVLPGQLVAAAREAHSNEALLALLVVVVWHLYSVVLSPACFPADLSIFTGQISERRLLEEHPLEHERLVAEGVLPAPTPHAEARWRRAFRPTSIRRRAAARRGSSRDHPD